MTFLALVPENIDEFPPLLQMSGEMLHPITFHLDQLTSSKIHNTYRNIHTLIAVQNWFGMFGDVKQQVDAHY